MQAATLNATKPDAPRLQSSYENHEMLLREIPVGVIKQAWFTMAHLILDPGSRILDVGCGNGDAIYAMAVMNPDFHFIGIDRNKKQISEAKSRHVRPNLEFMAGDITENFLPPRSLDAVINTFTLHQVYSRSLCNEKAVLDSLDKHFDLLKPNGLIFIRDYAMPDPDEFVILEMPEEPSKSNDAFGMSEVDLLIQFSEQARAREDPIHGGFYLEDLPPRFPRTRRFRLPHRWAYEFLIRKDDRDKWQEELHTEYTFFTMRDYRKTLRGMGARVLYSAPHWDDNLIKTRFAKKFKLYNENSEPLGPPQTSFIVVAQKIPEKQSIVLTERRPSRDQARQMKITAMRDDVEGKIVDVVTRNIEITEIIPYYITANKKLRVFVHEGIPRGLVNTVPRISSSLDGKKWSGHMTEAIAVSGEAVQTVKEFDRKSLILFARDYLGVMPAPEAELEDGPGLYPAPDHIDEKIETKYLRVETEKNDFAPRYLPEDITGYSTGGRIRDVDAQSILNASSVGMLPTARLEIQILALYEKLKLPYDSWSDCPLTIKEENPKNTTRLQNMIHKLAEHDDRYKEIKGVAGQIKTVNSIFVEEGRQEGGITGLASRNVEFVLEEDSTQNIAVILPLTRKLSGEVMAGVFETYLPVPQRYSGTGFLISCPSMALPKEITNFELARKYIADKFEVSIDNVSRMGEGFFTHIGVTPQRVYPFAVAHAGAKGWRKVGRTHGPCHYAPLYNLADILYLDNYYSFLKVAAEGYKFALGLNSSLSPGTSFSYMQSAGKAQPMSLRASMISSSEYAPEPAAKMTKEIT